MAGLALKLAPNERVMINGVVVENGPRRTQLLIKSENAAVLRMREALEDSDVIGPASRAYYTAQQGVAGLVPLMETEMALVPLLDELAGMSAFNEFSHALKSARENLSQGQLYRAMRALRPLVNIERDAVQAGERT